MSDLFLQRTAKISPCGVYRYLLTRRWSSDPWLVWLMLNPSVADADVDDRTVVRCMSFAQGFGYGGIKVVNLFAFRATDPKVMFQAVDPVGPENDETILNECAGEFVVCAWGATDYKRKVKARVAQVAAYLPSNALALECLARTAKGHPQHPLFVHGHTTLKPFNPMV